MLCALGDATMSHRPDTRPRGVRDVADATCGKGHAYERPYAKWAKTRATTMAARELFPAPTIWPMLTGTSLYVGRGDTMVPFGKPEEVGYLQSVS
jgi:hypothetical protein